VIRTFPSRFRPIFLGLAVVTFASSAHAFERITLRNGFSYDCSHHEIVGQHVRLYTGSGDLNYQDITAADITGIDTLPDPPAPAVVKTTPTPSNQSAPTLAEMNQMLAHAGAEHDIDAELLASVVKAESNFRVNATSRAGARGLMQLMPSTAHDLGVQDITRADQNINGGTAYLDSLLKLYKDDIRLALAAYNAGPAAVARYHGIPPFPETRAYVIRVIQEFNRRKSALALAATTTVASR